MSAQEVATLYITIAVVLAAVFYIAGKLHMHVFSRTAREKRRLDREIHENARAIAANDPHLAEKLNLEKL